MCVFFFLPHGADELYIVILNVRRKIFVLVAPVLYQSHFGYFIWSPKDRCESENVRFESNHRDHLQVFMLEMKKLKSG